jgi:hypothetical protein
MTLHAFSPLSLFNASASGVPAIAFSVTFTNPSATSAVEVAQMFVLPAFGVRNQQRVSNTSVALTGNAASGMAACRVACANAGAGAGAGGKGGGGKSDGDSTLEDQDGARLATACAAWSWTESPARSRLCYFFETTHFLHGTMLCLVCLATLLRSLCRSL